MITYDVIRERTLITLINVINEMIKKRWHPQGGVAMDSDGYYLQAMILVTAG